MVWLTPCHHNMFDVSFTKRENTVIEKEKKTKNQEEQQDFGSFLKPNYCCVFQNTTITPGILIIIFKKSMSRKAKRSCGKKGDAFIKIRKSSKNGSCTLRTIII